MRIVACLLLACLAAPLPGQIGKANGYRGIWYMNQPLDNQYVYKYSGGMATYPQQHVPIAIYSKEANKTFFVYGGTVEGKRELLHMVSYYDHATGKLPRPTILLNKKTGDAHDNPVLSIDDRGYLWVFSNAHGTGRPAFLHRGAKPYDIDRFIRIEVTNYSYSQPWFVPGKGFLHMHTLYRDGGRGLFWRTSPDGLEWSARKLLARVHKGHYEVSWRRGGKVGTLFNYHPNPVGLNARTNLYYLETGDLGVTWKTAAGRPVEVPVTEPDNPALVHDFASEGQLAYLKDLQFDRDGRPVLCFLNSRGFESGPESGPRVLKTARWTGSEWEIRPIAEADHNYDHGSLYIEPDGTWRFIGPTGPGPQPYGTGGEIVMWVSSDQGETWTSKQLTHDSPRNHTYVRRPVNAHPDFYAIWADGDAFKPSESRLYFTDREGSGVWRLPEQVGDGLASPEQWPE